MELRIGCAVENILLWGVIDSFWVVKSSLEVVEVVGGRVKFDTTSWLKARDRGSASGCKLVDAFLRKMQVGFRASHGKFDRYCCRLAAITCNFMDVGNGAFFSGGFYAIKKSRGHDSSPLLNRK